jgi:preprotein translocase subunit SecY
MSASQVKDCRLRLNRFFLGKGRRAGMIPFIRIMSIAANILFVVFLWFLIHNQAGTLRWIHGVNPLWALFVLITVIALAAIYAEWSENKKSTARQTQAEAETASAAPKAGPETAT